MKNYLVRISCLLGLLILSVNLSAQMGNPIQCRDFSKPSFTTIKYRASIDVLKKHLSGILIFKQEDVRSFRVVFINEVGTTFFDLSLEENEYIFHSILSSMDKKAVKQTLAKDIGMILIQSIFENKNEILKTSSYYELKLKRKGKVQYHPNYNCTQYPKIQNIGKKKTVTTINQFYLTNESMADSIFVDHHNFHFTISLKQMHVTE